MTLISTFSFLEKVVYTWKCREVIFNITHFGYYTLVFQPQPENTLFNFSVMFNYNYLDLSLFT